MARAAVPGRLTWRIGRLAGTRQETATARTLVLDVPGWPGHLPGQHVDVRLTAEDGYSTERSYSIASAPDGARLELTVQRLDAVRGKRRRPARRPALARGAGQDRAVRAQRRSSRRRSMMSGDWMDGLDLRGLEFLQVSVPD